MGRFAQIGGTLFCIGLLAVALLGCGPVSYPPDFHVVDPRVVTDDQGNVIVLYQISTYRGPVTYLQKLGPNGDRLWGEKGVRLDEREPDYPDSRYVTSSFMSPMMIADDGGGVTVFWPYQGQIYAEKLDKDGNPLWQPARVAVATLHTVPNVPGSERYAVWALAANDTGATLVWSDQNLDLNARSLDSSGHLLWTAEVSHPAADEVVACRDQTGSTWVVWMVGTAIYLQVVDEAGKTAWREARELRRSGQNGGGGRAWGHTTLWLAEKALGGVVVAWQDSQDSNRGPVEARSVSPDGQMRVIPTGQYGGQDVQATLPTPLIVGQGGLITLYDISGALRAQRLDLQGNALWGESGVLVAAHLAVSVSETGGALFQGSDQAEGTVASWEAHTSEGLVWCAQRIDAQGHLLWPVDGVTISTVTGDIWRWQWLATTSDGAAILSGVESEPGSGQSRIQKVSLDGKVLWGKDGIRLDDWRDADSGAGTTDTIW